MDGPPDTTGTPDPATESGDHVAESAASPAFAAVPVTRPAASAPQVGGRGIAIGFGVALLVAIVVLQAITLASLSGQGDDVTALRDDIEALDGSVGDINSDLSVLGDRVDALGTAATSSVAGPSSGPAAAVAGGLPAYQGPEVQDAALGITIGELSGTEWYSNAALTVSPTDGKARVYLVWAHWCPFCQQDLDTLQTWWPENKDRFPNTDLVSVSTFQDETRSNPLDAYLEASQFGFPVLLDDAQATLAIQLGNGGSVPYWIFTDAAGQVVGRHAGLLEQEQIDNVFTQLEELAAGA